VARELETGTHRLVWNQSVTRRRWLAAKLLVVGGASAVVAGGFSAALTWAAGPVDRVAAGAVTDPLAMGRFSTLLFGTRNIAPVGYAVFALVLGASVGMMVRRTVPAMALTLLLFTVVQVAAPNLVRPHLSAPVTVSQPVTVEMIKGLSFLGNHATFKGLRIPNASVTSTSRLLTASGQPLDDAGYDGCFGAGKDLPQCLSDLNLHVQVSYQPEDRYWRFQLLESALFLVLSLLLAGFGLWRIHGRIT
jgi:hypothetical protein